MGRDHRCQRSTGRTPDARPAAVLWLRGLGATILALLMWQGQAVAQAPSGAPPRNPATDASDLLRQRAQTKAAQTYAGQTPTAQGPILSISASPSQVTAPAGGGLISYSLVVSNLGRSTLANVAVTVLRNGQPETVTFSGPCSTPCLIQRIEPGGQRNITVTEPGAGGGFTLTAQATASEPRRQTVETRINVAAAPQPPPAPSLSISASPSLITPSPASQSVSYTVSVGNSGAGAATNVQLSAVVNGQQQQVRAQGPCASLPCALGDLRPGDIKTVQVNQPIISLGGFTVRVQVSSAQSKPRFATVTVAAVPPPPSADVSISATLDRVDGAGADRVANYTVTVTNAGPDAATGVGLNAYVGGGVRSASAIGDCARLPCTLDRIGPQETKTARVSQPIMGDAQAFILLRAAGPQPDPDTGNNDARITVPPPPSGQPPLSDQPPDKPPKQADLSLIEARPTAVRVEGDHRVLDYAVIVENTGQAAATEVRLNAYVARHAQMASAQGDCMALPCALGAIKPGERKAATVSELIAADGQVDIAVQVAGAQPDPTPEDNTKGITVSPPAPPVWPIALAVAALAILAAGLGAWRYRQWLRLQKLKAYWRPKISVTPRRGVPAGGHPGPLTFRAPPVGLTVRLALGEGGPQGAIPITARVKHE